MSAEDLTVRAGLALRQAFLDAHPDLYEQRHGAVRRMPDGWTPGAAAPPSGSGAGRDRRV
jgi:hypothetical protein